MIPFSSKPLEFCPSQTHSSPCLEGPLKPPGATRATVTPPTVPGHSEPGLEFISCPCRCHFNILFYFPLRARFAGALAARRARRGHCGHRDIPESLGDIPSPSPFPRAPPHFPLRGKPLILILTILILPPGLCGAPGPIPRCCRGPARLFPRAIPRGSRSRSCREGWESLEPPDADGPRQFHAEQRLFLPSLLVFFFFSELILPL